MKKGFAWLLCLIMLTGLFSSAAVAADAPKAKVTFNNNNFVNYTWTDGNSKLPEFGFTFKVEKPDKKAKKHEWSAEAHWFLKTSTDEDFKEVKLNETNNGYQEFKDKDFDFDKELSAGIILETADEARQAGEYKCVIIVKHNGAENNRVENTKTVKVIRRVSLTFDYENWWEYDKTITVNAGEKITDKPANPTNYDSTRVFDGWVYKGTTEKLDLDAPVTKGGTLVPSWKAAKIVYSVTFYNNHRGMSTTGDTIQAGDDGKVVPKPLTVCSSENHDFAGWYTTAECKETFNFDKALEKNENVYAGWGYRVKFDLGGVEVVKAINDQVVLEDSLVKMPENPVATDGSLVFDHWEKDGKTYDFNKKVKGRFTLVAVWKKAKQAIGLKQSYVLTYNGESQNVDIVGTDGEAITIPSNAYKLSYERVGGGDEPDVAKDHGWYSVTLSLTEEGQKNYSLIEGANGAGLVIYQKPITVSWKDETFVYDGAKHCPEPTVKGICDGDTDVFSVKGEQVNAGESYTAEVEIINNNYCFPENYDGQTKAFSIAKRPVTITWGDTDLTYNGNERTPSVIIDGLRGIWVDGVVAEVSGGVVLGEGTAVVELQGDAKGNYSLPDNASIAFTVSKIKPTLELKDTRDSVTYLDSFDIAYELKNADPDSVISVNSSNNKVASVKLNKKTGKITITGTEIGSTTITVKVAAIGGYEEATASFELKVNQIETGLTLTGTKNSVVYGEEFKIGYKKVNASNGAITFKSSDENVASIDRNGNIKALKTGEVTITVTMAETTHHTGATASFTFEVTQRVVTIDWSNTRLVYNGNPQLPGYTVKNVVNGDDIKLVVTGAQTDAGKNYRAVAAIDNDNYKLDDKTAQKTFSIEKAKSTISAKDIKKIYGDEPFEVSYDSITGGNNVTVEVQWNNGVAYLNREKKVVITGAGEAYIKLTNHGDANHEQSTVTIKLTVDKKKVPVVWDNSDDPEVFTWDGKNHCPTAHVEKSYLVGNDKCDVKVSGSTKNVGTFTAKVTGLSNTNYEVDKEYSKKFTIKDVVKSTKLTTNWQTKTVYYIPVDGEKIELNLTGISIVEKFMSGAKDRITQVTSDMIDTSFDPAKLGKQNVKVNYNNMEFTFEIQIIKMIEPVWGDTNLTYTGEVQAPEFSVKGLKDDAFDKVIKVTADKDALDVNKNNTKYTAEAVINRDFNDKYIFTDYHHHSYKYYTIAPKQVTLTWILDDAAFVPSVFGGYDCDFFVDSKVLAPTGKIDVDADILALTIRDADGNPIENATSVGVYTIEASLTNSNYVFKAETTTSVSFRIINKASGADISVLIPQCGQKSGYSGFEIRVGVDGVRNGMIPVKVADLDAVAVDQYAPVALSADAKPVVEEAIAAINWASLGQADADSTLNVKGILVPRIEGTFTDDENFFNAVGSFEDDVVSVEGDKTYSVILILTANPLTGFDADVIKANLTVSDKNGQKTLRYVAATKYGVVALVDVDAVHNYDDTKDTITEPEEGKDGNLRKYCYLEGAEDYTHYTDFEIPALKVTEIKVVKGEGFKDSYFVGDAFDYTGLKILVSLSNGEEAFDKSYERDVTEDMISGFDSTEAGKKTITVKYGDCEDTFEVTVSKKQSTIDLKNVGDKVTATYGDAPIDLVFDAVNGEVIISSTDEKVAKVENGKLVIVGAGETTITLEIKDTDAVVGIKKSFTFVVEQKVVGLEWSKDNAYTEDGTVHRPTVKVTGLVGTDTCDVTVEGGSAEVGTHTVKAIELSNKNYKLPENASTTFVINAKEEPKTEDPKKEEPKTEEPKKEEPKFTTVITIGTNFKVVYDKGDKFDPTGLTIEVVNEKGEKTVVDVTEDMVKGFDSSKEGDIVITIQYKDASKEVPIKIVSYNTKTFFNPDGSFKSETHRSEHDELTFKKLKGVYINKKLVDPKYYRAWSGSLHLLISADFMKSLPAGENELEILFEDGKSVVSFTVAAPAPSDASPVTGDTGNQMMWIILLAAAAVVLVVIRVYAAKRSNAE